MFEFHPGFILILGGLIAALVPQRLRRIVMVGTPVLAIMATLGLQEGAEWQYLFINQLELIVLKADRLSLLFAFVFSVLVLLGSIYALHLDCPGETMAAFFYAGSSLSVIFAGDWLTLIFFWEIMAISSVFLIWNRRKPESLKAGFRYLMVHLLGGSLLLAGIFLQVSGGQFVVAPLTGMSGWSYWLILLGISVNAAIPPLHVWLTDAYPEATLTGSVFLCALTTKTAVYALLRIFPGTRLLLWLGVIMAIYGVIYAILENDIRRLLSYHIVSQIGFMVAGVGIGTELALNGAAAHAYCHILYKALLFMGAGAVIYATGYEKLTELGGLYRQMPLTAIFFSIGAFSISGLPLFNGFVSKSIIISAASLNQMPTAELLLTLASVGTFLSIALKLNYFMFFGPKREIKVKKIPFNMTVGMAGLSFLCVLYGVCPQLLYQRLPFVMDYVPYTFDHVISTLQLVLAVFMVFWVFRSRLLPHNAISLDFDWFYRKPFVTFVWWVVQVICRIKDSFGVWGNAALAKVIPFFNNPVKWLPQTIEGPPSAVYDDNKYRLPIGVTVFMGVFLFVLLFSSVCF
jgi:multicomponent Na+:H+ antiporter subunit D